MADTIAERITVARQRAEQAKARLQALEAQASAAARKRDTRRKVILGGLLLDAAEKDERFTRVVTALLDRISRDQDRKAFDGWQAPTPSPTTPSLGVNQPASQPAQTAP